MKRGKVDLTLALFLFLLLVIGTIMVFSASSIMAINRYHSLTYFFRKQLVWSLLSLLLLVGFSKFDYRILQKPPLPFILLASAFALLAGLYGFGLRINGARRWYSLGLFNFQPSEFAKWAIIIYFAHYISGSKRNIRNFKEHFLPLILILAGMMVLIMFQPDLSTALMLGIICLSLMYVGGAKMKHLTAISLPLLPAVIFLLTRRSYQAGRISSWIKGLHDPMQAGYQIRQSLIGLGRGGWFGNGLGQSKQKFFFLPDSHTDFIFSILGEEFGFIGATLVLLIFLFILYRGIYIARKSPDNFGKFLALGITLSIVLYAFINVAVVSMLVPATGLPMPFVSYGGSNLIFLGFSGGLLLSISRHSRQSKPNWSERSERTERLYHTVITTD